MGSVKKVTPSDYVTEYVAATLDAPKTLMIACQRSISQYAASEIEAQEAIATTMMMNGEAVALSDDFFSRFLDRVEEKAPSEKAPSEKIPSERTLSEKPPSNDSLPNAAMSKAYEDNHAQIASEMATASPLSDILPKPLVSFMNGQAINWSLLALGMKCMPLWHGEHGENLYLLKVKGGIPMPDHKHIGEGLSLILTGSYHVESTQYSRGDLHVEDGHCTHIPVVDPGKDCICLVLNQAEITPMKMLDQVLMPLASKNF